MPIFSVFLVVAATASAASANACMLEWEFIAAVKARQKCPEALRSPRGGLAHGSEPGNHRGRLFFGDHAIAERYESAGVRGHSFARHQDSGHIQRIRRGNRNRLSGGRLLPHRSQRFHRDWERELLAQKIADESSPA